MEPLARAHDTIKAALDIFEQSHQSSQPVPSRGTLQQAAERLKGETAKGMTALTVPVPHGCDSYLEDDPCLCLPCALQWL
jgi:hypothetical protein